MGTERRTREAPAGGQARLGRDFWFYFSGQAVSQRGGSFTTFALPLLVFKLTHSATNLALTTAAEFAPYLPGQILGPRSPARAKAWPMCGPIRYCAPSRS